MATDNFTYREIVRQQAGWKSAIEALAGKRQEYKEILKQFSNRCWIFSGCGTSFYLAQTASVLFELLTGIRSRAVPASEILMFPNLIFNKSDRYIVISMSRSGTTTETVKAAEKARNDFDIPTLAISCNSHSPLNTDSTFCLAFPFEKESSVVMTGSFTTMLISVLYLASLAGKENPFVDQIDKIAEASHQVMVDNEALVKQIIEKNHYNDFVFLGQGPLLGIANEAALKMQEMAISVSLSYHSLEYRHGPMSTASDQSLITILCCEPAEKHEVQLARDLRKLGPKIFVLTGSKNGFINSDIDFAIRVPAQLGDTFKPLLYMPILQLLAYYRAISNGINPDKPKNLSQVVELEM
jgi:glucosamine--fructose-6-phosphate aminotransferase (isomerizing)